MPDGHPAFPELWRENSTHKLYPDVNPPRASASLPRPLLVTLALPHTCRWRLRPMPNRLVLTRPMGAQAAALDAASLEPHVLFFPLQPTWFALPKSCTDCEANPP